MEMKQFLGVKLLLATAMTRGEYNAYRGWNTPMDENPADLGMLVEYDDPDHPNHPKHKGYISWSPIGVFKDAYRETSGLSFGLAIEAAKKGFKIARAGWNGKDMFIVHMPSMYLPPYNTQDTERKVNDRTAKFIGKDAPLDCQQYFSIYTADKKWQPGWLASQADMFADDWMIIE